MLGISLTFSKSDVLIIYVNTYVYQNCLSRLFLFCDRSIWNLHSLKLYRFLLDVYIRNCCLKQTQHRMWLYIAFVNNKDPICHNVIVFNWTVKLLFDMYYFLSSCLLKFHWSQKLSKTHCNGLHILLKVCLSVLELSFCDTH